MLRSLTNKSSLIASNLNPFKVASFGTLSSKVSEKENDFVPGVKGYSPDFAPPPFPKRKEKKGKAKPTIVQQKPQTKVSGESVKDFSALRYKEQLTFLRKEYLKEHKEVVSKREEESSKILQAEEILKQKTFEEKELLASQIEEARKQDYLSSLNVLDEKELKSASGNKEGEINPFTDPVRKAARLEIKAQNFTQSQDELKKARKEQLLKIFYESEHYITPQNLDRTLDHFFLHDSTYNSHISAKPTLDISLDPSSSSHSKVSRSAQLFDALNDTIKKRPNVEKITESNSSSFIEDWANKKSNSLGSD